jgi:hypothetical protein
LVSFMEELWSPGSTAFKSWPHFLKQFSVDMDSRLLYRTQDSNCLCVPLPGGWRERLTSKLHESTLASHVGTDRTTASL